MTSSAKFNDRGEEKLNNLSTSPLYKNKSDVINNVVLIHKHRKY